MSIQKELSYLYQIGQEHLLDECSKWPLILQKQFNMQLEQFSATLFQEQRTCIQGNHSVLPLLQDPSRVTERTNTLCRVGESMIQERKVGLILLAGGQGSRLGFLGPKGCMPLPKLQKRTLLSIILNKCASLQKTVERPLPIAIMTSRPNHFRIQNYLKEKNFFALSREQITLFQQQSFPLLNMDGNWYIQSPGLLGQGPGGNGAAFGEATSLLLKWKQEGIRWVQVIPIDNPLATPFDPYLLGCHRIDRTDLAILTVKRDSDITEVGLIGENYGKIYIQEYSNPSLQSHLLFAYIGIFSCSIDLALKWKNSLRWHAVKKEGFIYQQRGYQKVQTIWKLEKFLFDIFSSSMKHSILLGKKEECFAPIKRACGRYGIEMAQNYFLQNEAAMHLYR